MKQLWFPVILHAVWVQEALNLDLSDEGLRAIAVNNCIAQQAITTHTDHLKPVLHGAIKLSDTLFEKVRPLV